MHITVYLLTLLLVAVSNSLNVVVARSQQRVEVAALYSEDSHSPIQYDDRTNDRLPTLISHHTSHPFMDLERVQMEGKIKVCSVTQLFDCSSSNDAAYLHQHAEKRLLVLGPECGKLLSRGEQTTASIHCNFRTVAKVHTEVLGDK